MKKSSLINLMVSLLLTATLFQGCKKQNDQFAPASTSTEVDQKENEEVKAHKVGLIECELNDVNQTVYHDLLVPYFMAGVLNDYWSCSYPAVEAGECCNGGGTIDLSYLVPSVPYGIEEWYSGASSPYDPLSDGVFSASEQLDLLNRAILLANNNIPSCKNGQLVLAKINIQASPTLGIPGAITIHAYATYAPVCLFSL